MTILISVLFTHLEALVLQDPLDRCILSIRGKLCLEDYTKRAISYNLALCVLHFLGFTGQAILDFLTYNLFPVVSSKREPVRWFGVTYLPCASLKTQLGDSA